MSILEIFGEYLLKLNSIRIEFSCQSFKDILGRLEFEITKPNIVKVTNNNGDKYNFIFKDIEFETESISNLQTTDKKVSFIMKCALISNKPMKINCKCINSIGDKLKLSYNVCCSFCYSDIASTKNITKVKSQISENNQLEEIFFCHGNTEKLTDVVLETTECVIHGLDFSISKILLNNENINVKKNILSCGRCQKIFGRIDIMSNNQLKLFSTELLARIPMYDIDGDEIDQENVTFCNTELEINHLILNNIINHEAIKILLIGISDNKLTDMCLLWNFQQIFSVYRGELDLHTNERIKELKKENHFRLLCLPNTSSAFLTKLNSWSHDMSVYHIMATEDVCLSFIDSLLNLRSSDVAVDDFIPCSILLHSCL